jgi:hypothetical protein
MAFGELPSRFSCRSTISAQTRLRVCRHAKPLRTLFPDRGFVLQLDRRHEMAVLADRQSNCVISRCGEDRELKTVPID